MNSEKHTMRLLRISDSIEDESCGCIGTFDGFHIGHSKILEDVICYAKNKGVKSLIITFKEHPKLDRNLLFSHQERLEYLKSLKVDYILLLERKDMELSADEFVNILINRFKLRRIIMGWNNGFGKGREGNPSWLIKNLEKFPLEVVIFPPIRINGKVVSSSVIRKMLLEGDVEGVIPLLGRRYSLIGRKIKGSGIGRSLGFPTINIKVPEEKLIPMDGVYLVYLPDLGRYGVMHIGDRPTLNLGKSMEIHIPDFSGEVEGEIKLEFLRRIRDVMRFRSVEELKERIKKDIEIALCTISSSSEARDS